MENRDGWLRIITLNTWKGDGAYRKRLPLMASQLNLLQPDVLFLQEAVKTEDGDIDTTGYLADFLGLHSAFAPARKKIRQIDDLQYLSYSGLAILSTYKITGENIAILPSSPEDSDRISLSAVITVNEKKILLTNLHLTHQPNADCLRLRQFAAVTNHIIAAGNPNLWLCAGDFNCVLEKDFLQEITENSWFQIVDCYLAGGGKLPGTTIVENGTPLRKGRIDYILNLIGEGMSTPPCKNSRIVLNRPDIYGNLPSDHFGVMSDIFIGNL